MENSAETLKDILQWNIAGWSPVIEYWSEVLNTRPRPLRVLELGARDGGISLFFASQGCEVICSDIRPPSDAAKALHLKHSVENKIEYATLDATRIDLPSAGFDVVAFKSVLGGIAFHQGFDGQKRAIVEIMRVLRPGGHLLFAENLCGTIFHRALRKAFIRNRGPEGTWIYPSLTDFRSLLQPFSLVEYRVSGVLSPLGRTEKQRTWLHRIDSSLERLVPESQRMIVFGSARKADHDNA